MNVLISGASGFIGRAIIRNSNKMEITGLSRKACSDLPIRQLIGDMSCIMPSHYDIVIHCAWERYHDVLSDVHLTRNFESSMIFLRNVVSSGCKHLVIIGTCLEYGNICGELTEDLKTDPSTPYGIAKDSLRKFVFSLYPDILIQWVRPFFLYGPFQRAGSLTGLIDACPSSLSMTGGEQIRDYMHVDSFVLDLLKLIEARVPGIFNICSSIPISVRSFAEKYRGDRKVRLDFGKCEKREWEPLAFWGSRKKIDSVLKGTL